MPFGPFKINAVPLSSVVDFVPKKNILLLCSILMASVCFVFSISHVVIVNYERKVLTNYGDEIFARAQKISFQIFEIIDLIDEVGESSCKESYLSDLREVLSHFYFIEDAGRIDGSNILCTAKMGILEPPKTIKYFVSPIHSVKDIRVLITRKELFFPGEIRAILNYKNIFITLVPYTYYGVKNPDENTGGLLKNYDTNQVYRVYHNIDVAMAEDFSKNTDNFLYYFPLPGQVLKIEMCSELYRYCLNAIDYKLGLYDISVYELLMLVVIALFVAYTAYISIDYVKNVKGTMKFRLAHAIEHNQIYPLYQPKFNLKTGQVVGVEALARWQDDKLGFVAPDVFIALAEEMKVIKDITTGLTRIVLEEAKPLLRADKNFTVSINLSVQDLLDADFLSFIEAEVEHHGIRRQQIILEITERSATESEGLSSSTHALYEKGYQISLDDFGTGFCNLAWLSKLESNEIKIDRMFTHSISSRSVGLVTLDGICQLLEEFHMKTVFEGIETKAELAYILDKSPDALGQGWLFAKAMPMAEVKLLLAEQA